MNGELINCYAAYLSGDNDLISKANDFINNQIHNNLMLFSEVFEIFSNSPNLQYKKLSLIIIKQLIISNFKAIQQDFQRFSQVLNSSIINSQDKEILFLLAEIVFQTAIRTNGNWDDFPAYLTLYRDQIDFLPLCIYLYYSSFRDEDILKKYGQIINELNAEIILKGLQSQDPNIQANTAYIFAKSTKKFEKESDILPYQEQYSLLHQIAENSMNMEMKNFLLFWSQLTRMNRLFTGPLYKIAQQFLGLQNLKPDIRMKLLEFVIVNYQFVNVEDLEPIINDYFNVQLQLDDLDTPVNIFLCLSNVDTEISYELFKSSIIELISSDDLKAQYVGSKLIDTFAISYIKEIPNDISCFIDLSLKIATNTPDNFESISNFLYTLLNLINLDTENTDKVFSFLFEIFVNQMPPELQYKAYKVYQSLNPSSSNFDKLVEIFEKVQLQSLSIYFSCLLYVHSYENNMTQEKYDPFFSFLINIFQQSCQKVDELAKEHKNQPQNAELNQEYFNFALLRGSSANLIFLFSYYNPSIFGGLVEPAINCFIDMIQITGLSLLESSQSFSLFNLKEDFTFVFDQMKNKAIELVRPYYSIISEAEEIERFQSLIVPFDGLKFPPTETFINEFSDIFKRYKETHKMTFEDLQFAFIDVVEPMSKWIYKVPNLQLHCCFVSFILNVINDFSPSSFDIFNNGTRILRRLVKPYRIKYNESSPWFLRLCQKLSSDIATFVDKLIPKLSQFIHSQCFLGLVNIMMIFVYSQNEIGHSFLESKILPFYERDQVSNEIDLLILFENMLENKYYNENELGIMVQVVNGIIERGNLYADSRPELFKLITCLTKLSPEISAQYFQFALNVLEEVKNEKLLINIKIYCSYFLLSSYNKNPTGYKIIVQLFPEILSVFPAKQIMNQFFEEIKAFIEINKENLSKEIVEAIINAFARYLSYQNFASFIFRLSDEQHAVLLDIFTKLIKMYLPESPAESLQELLVQLLPGQPSSVQYILSLL